MISFIFCQELFYNFLTFNISKCLIVRLLLEKTFTILSSLSKLVNSFFIFFKNYFSDLFWWCRLYKTIIILAFLLTFVKIFLNISSIEILYCSSSLSEDFYYSIITSRLCQHIFFNLFLFLPWNLFFYINLKKRELFLILSSLIYLLYIVKVKYCYWQISLVFWS